MSPIAVQPPAHRRTRRIAAAALIAACTGIATGVAQAADTAQSPNSAKRATGITSVHGSGGGELQFSGFEGDQVNFDIRGHTTDADSPVSVKGTFAVTHERPDGTLFAEMSGSLDCMWVAGDVAVATGVIEEYDMPGLPELEPAGRRVGFTIDDGGRHDRIGWSWAVTGFEGDVSPCMSTAPFFEVERGWFAVHD